MLHMSVSLGSLSSVNSHLLSLLLRAVANHLCINKMWLPFFAVVYRAISEQDLKGVYLFGNGVNILLALYLYQIDRTLTLVQCVNLLIKKTLELINSIQSG